MSASRRDARGARVDDHSRRRTLCKAARRRSCPPSRSRARGADHDRGRLDRGLWIVCLADLGRTWSLGKWSESAFPGAARRIHRSGQPGHDVFEGRARLEGHCRQGFRCPRSGRAARGQTACPGRACSRRPLNYVRPVGRQRQYDSFLGKTEMKVILAQPRGFCAGVVRAIEIVERALQKYGPPVYVRHEIVHNKYVVESLKNKGAIFVEDLSEVPPRAVTVFSAHGVARSVEEEAAARGLPVLNATCPLVTKVHNQGKRYMSKGRALILIGHAGHPEVEGTMGQVPGPVTLVQNVDDVGALTLPTDTPVAYITQTTLSVDDTKDIIAALQARFTDIQGPDIRDICYATQNRQSAVRDLSKLVDVILVVGAANSSNSNRLREIGTEVGVASYLIADGSELNPDWLKDAKAVGITAGASAPEVLVDDVIEALRRIGPVKVSVLPGREENIEFRLPAELTAG